MEHHTADIVRVAFQRVHFPMFIAAKTPQFDCFVVGGRREDLHCWVECYPVHTLFVALQDVLNFDFSAAVELVGFGAGFGHGFLLELVEVPNADGLVQTARGDQSVVRVESGCHYVMRVASQDGNAETILPVPDPDCLIVGAGDNPRQLQMEFNSAHVVQMALESEHAFLCLVVPHLD